MNADEQKYVIKWGEFNMNEYLMIKVVEEDLKCTIKLTN